jgi:hypothetical protein
MLGEVVHTDCERISPIMLRCQCQVGCKTHLTAAPESRSFTGELVIRLDNAKDEPWIEGRVSALPACVLSQSRKEEAGRLFVIGLTN